MSVERIYNVVCEVPDCVRLPIRSKLTVLDAQTPGHAIVEAKRGEWRHTAGHDICPACWTAGWRYHGTWAKGDWRRRS